MRDAFKIDSLEIHQSKARICHRQNPVLNLRITRGNPQPTPTRDCVLSASTMTPTPAHPSLGPDYRTGSDVFRHPIFSNSSSSILHRAFPPMTGTTHIFTYIEYQPLARINA